MSENILVYGASSAIVQAVMRHFAKEGCSFVLVARNSGRLKSVAQDLQTRGAQRVETLVADLNDFSGHDGLWQAARTQLGTIHRVIMGHGSLGSQELSEKDYHTAEMEFRTNLLSCISILTPIANHMEADGMGQIAVISSVAGDRGRKSNYIYGSAKAALSTYLSGLRQRLSKAGVSVLTIKPGFVDTPMTSEVDKNALFASPEQVGSDIYRAMKKGQSVLYTPRFWLLIMTVIRLIPEFIFKRLPL
ncbi:SDR family oxidoreductase [Pseudobacteriovorax antillogorgiicola]|uniref:Short-chain dehydrogenase n=1 Tax=Pseudobacteriovorax antillogorgiicola TaxID=1513793 RepID=A0A1Y6CCP5_9BACT|nr:SDR family oxidoreductase [Pseudobacteriovorax antillogorgiicola]TCS48352.1 short-subunit dehydrogenase [Pseudobacteriovorax antillogorgiicola]SMF56266.1 Short-chain dehydrogenase [Pseudobacteriovorax antillogorgiicola]